MTEEYPQTNPGGKPRNETNDNRGCLRGAVIGVIGCAGILVVIVGAVVFIGGATLSGVGDSVRAVVDRIFPAPSATVDTSSTVVKNVRLLGDLVTLRTQLVKARVAVSLRQGILEACNLTALYVAEGTFEAGINLSRITSNDLVYNEETNSYVLTVPQPYLRSCHVRVEQYSETLPVICTADWPQITNLAEYVAMQEFLNDMAGDGMYGVARDNAQIVIGSFVENLLGTDTEIQFSNQPTRAEDASCRVLPPTGWTQDDERSWTRR